MTTHDPRRHDHGEEIPEKEDEDPVTRREALETELMEREASERGEEIGNEIDGDR